jgi:SNF2 family DNA or RNA helicase
MTQAPLNDTSTSSKYQKSNELKPTSYTTSFPKSITQQPHPKETLVLIENYVEKIVQTHDPFAPSQTQPDSTSEIKQLLNNFSDVSTREFVEERDSSPTLTLTLRPYQKRALAWMINREHPCSLNNVSSSLTSFPHLFSHRKKKLTFFCFLDHIKLSK